MTLPEATSIKNGITMPLAAIVAVITMAISLAATYSHSQAQVAVLMDNMIRVQVDMKEMVDRTASIDVVEAQLESILVQIDKLDRRMAAQEQFKLYRRDTQGQQ